MFIARIKIIESVSLVNLDPRRMGRPMSQPRNQVFCTCVLELLEAQGRQFSFSK